MLTDFGLSRMLQYSHSILHTTTGRDSKIATTRWTAYELFDSNAPKPEEYSSSSSDEGSSDVDEGLDSSDNQEFEGHANEESDAVPLYSTLLTLTCDKRLTPCTGEDGEDGEDSEDGDTLKYTNMSDIWAFGMVIYASLFLRFYC